MTSSTLVTDDTVDKSSSPSTSSTTTPRCRVCKKDLNSEDKQKTTTKYWKSCHRCRDHRKLAATVRKMRTPAASSAKDGLIETLRKSGKKSYAEDYTSRSPFHSLLRKSRSRMKLRQRHSFLSSGFEAPLGTGGQQPAASKGLDSESLPSSPTLIGFYNWYQAKNRAQRENTAKKDVDKDMDELSKELVPEKPKEMDCSVCADSFPLQKFPRLKDCDHAPDVCHECLLQWLNQQMASLDTVTCPSSGCNNTVTHGDVQKHAPLEVYTRYVFLSHFMHMMLSHLQV
jgi:hypothetical protein